MILNLDAREREQAAKLLAEADSLRQSSEENVSKNSPTPESLAISWRLSCECLGRLLDLGRLITGVKR